jgi:predicted anti-sigma-YlaC factor YlaD
MKRPDHSTYREWLNLDADGALPREHRGLLDEHLAGCAECRAERDELLALESLLHRTRVPVRPDFRTQVMSSLPSVGWESRSPRTWAFPAAAFALFAAVAAATMGGGGSSGSHSSLVSALTAVAGMFRASAAAGAGLIAASWKGLGMAFAAALSSPMSLGAFGIFVLCLNLVLFSLLRRRRPVSSEAAEGAARRESREMDRSDR